MHKASQVVASAYAWPRGTTTNFVGTIRFGLRSNCIYFCFRKYNEVILLALMLGVMLDADRFVNGPK